MLDASIFVTGGSGKSRGDNSSDIFVHHQKSMNTGKDDRSKDRYDRQIMPSTTGNISSEGIQLQNPQKRNGAEEPKHNRK